jgi:hypothetical protein
MPKTKEASVRCLLKWPKQYYSSLKPEKIKDVLDSPVCSIGTFKRAVGEGKAVFALILILNNLVDFFNVGNSMSAKQVTATAEMIADDYGYLKIDDLRLCFNRAKKGEFGPVYRMDGNIILSWIGQYVKEREAAADEINYAQHASIRANEKRSMSFTELIEKETVRKK